jgi:hypothetical protein
MDKIDAFELDFDADLAVDDFDKLLDYNKHDIRATELFFDRCRSAVEIRHKLIQLRYKVLVLPYRMSKWFIKRGGEYGILFIIHRFCTEDITHFIHHSRTSLKDLEFNMNMDKIDAFELDFDADLAVDDFDKLLDYNKHDIRATELFFDRCRSAVEIRHKCDSFCTNPTEVQCVCSPILCVQKAH